MIVVMNMKKDFGRRIAAGLDVPAEALCNIPVGSFRGKEEFYLENHCGILSYEEDAISIAVPRGTVILRGRELSIANMRRRSLCIRGIITMIELE